VRPPFLLLHALRGGPLQRFGDGVKAGEEDCACAGPVEDPGDAPVVDAAVVNEESVPAREMT
jgi:hypothetical protein